MPRNAEGTLSADQVYALTAFLLYRNEIVKEDDVIDAKTLPKVQMPNRNGFIPQRIDEICDLPGQRGCRLWTLPLGFLGWAAHLAMEAGQNNANEAAVPPVLL